MKKKKYTVAESEIFSVNIAWGFILIFTLLALAGLSFHFYDKIFNLEVDYSKSIAYARHAWISASVARKQAGILSWSSALGHVLCNFYFIPIFLLLFSWEQLISKAKYVLLFLNVFIMLIYASTMGSRTIPFFFLCFFFGLILLKCKTCPGKKIRSYVFLCLVVVLLVTSYNFYIFKLRVNAFGKKNVKYYSESFYAFLGGEKKKIEKVEKVENIFVKIYYYYELTSIYIIHNHWTFAKVLEMEDYRKEMMFRYLWFPLERIGIKVPFNQTPSRTPGKFLSLPGSAYVTYGKRGMFIFAFILGCFIGLAEILVNIKKQSLGAAFFYVLVGIFVFSSFLTSAGSLLPFPFFCCAFFIFLISYKTFTKLKGRRYA
ncbi:MAG: hypothetical protein PHY73_05915 [Candidatus Omnitrophica bacterium]|nr:hypothetical protein [Candidatus Omnitrophota bacterium]